MIFQAIEEAFLRQGKQIHVRILVLFFGEQASRDWNG